MRPRGDSPERPRVVIVTGEPGSGKTTLGAELSRASGIPFVGRDQVRRGMFVTAGAWNGPVRSVPSSDDAVEAFLRIVETLSSLGVSCIVEYLARWERPDDLRRLRDAADCRVLLTWCHDATARFARHHASDRLLSRASVLDALGFATIDDHLADAIGRMRVATAEMRTDFDVPVLRVNTDDGYEPGLDEILDFVAG